MFSKTVNKPYIVLIAAWLAIFLFCSILSGIASSASTEEADTSRQTTVGTDTQAEAPSTETPPPATTDEPDPPATTDEPDLPAANPANAQYVIFLDAGHGWADTGALVPNRTDIYERDITLAITKKIQASLEAMGYTVRLIRENDQECPETLVDGIYKSSRRITYANNQGGDYYVSIHADSSEYATAHGPRVFYTDRRTPSKAFATNIADSLAERLHIDMTYEPRDNEPYNVIVLNSMPAVLIEVGYVTNPDELTNMLNEEWQESFARAVALGIDADVHPENKG